MSEELLIKFEELVLGHSTMLNKLYDRLRQSSTLSQLQMAKRKLLSEKAKLYMTNSSNLEAPEFETYIEENLTRLRNRYDDFLKLVADLIEQAKSEAAAPKPMKRNTEATYTALRDFIIAEDADRIISGIHKVLKTAKGKEMAKVLVYLQNNNFINVPDRQKTHIIRLLFKELNRAYSDNDRKAVSKFFSPAYFKTTYEDDFCRLDAIFK